MKIGIVGARLAGSYAGLLLCGMGHEVILFDDSLDKEKPCGGGITSKALRTMPWFREHRLPHTEVRNLRMEAADGYAANLALKHPIHIFSRATLDSALRREAECGGARLFPERASRFSRKGGVWAITTSRGEHEVEFLVGADGAAGSVRSALARKFQAGDLSLALGFYLAGIYHQDTGITVFQEQGFRGYLWSFPRVDHASVGVLCWLPVANAAQLRRRVSEFIAARYAGAEMRFYAARIPCLSRNTLVRQQVCGQDWALLGDAAGFADAITAEGIYFSLRSAELLAEAFRHGDPSSYERRWRQDFGNELEKAAVWRDRFYAGRFLFRAFTRRALQATRHSTTVRDLTDKLICGRHGYNMLRLQLLVRSPQILAESVRDKLGQIFL